MATHTDVLAALDAETDALLDALARITPTEYRRATRCAPWDVAALAVHTVGALDRVVAVLEAAPPPPGARTGAAGYYRPDVRFSAEVDADRVESAMAAAERADPALIAAAGARLRARLRPLLRAAPGDRMVRTRHGDAMTLTDFLVTRVLEILVHGLDLADALGRRPWATGPGVELVGGLFAETADRSALEGTGLTGLAFVRAATGRALPGQAGRSALAGTGVRDLALG
ncbi:maleylpyruvate isomerase family mycothiol-dependent enzyme [Nocardiopsis ansamitocini]|uniref:Mycothiol-dependent maleylpyruvate isomerase metal-binding domain-containing protein n=1 Tax=Nocardiopsis ansamitocini TaxID=1670832 RepID=A0A9W6P2P9_9ACTN|nr:maleylpyruvate isomerase family mycothiol-dependent enzyme [Nocardiopsis ansamitocini]GLU45997.1 hypothetical protein Nans01_03480 [Nocardiopsis ansamitocini]